MAQELSQDIVDDDSAAPLSPREKRFIGATIGVLVLALVAGSIWWYLSRQASSAQRSCEQATQAYTTVSKQHEDVLGHARKTLSGFSPVYTKARHQAYLDFFTATAPAATIDMHCENSDDVDRIRRAEHELNASMTRIHDTEKLALEDSASFTLHAESTLNSAARQTVRDDVDEAKQLLASSAGKLNTPAPTEALSSAVLSAEQLLAHESPDNPRQDSLALRAAHEAILAARDDVWSALPNPGKFSRCLGAQEVTDASAVTRTLRLHCDWSATFAISTTYAWPLTPIAIVDWAGDHWVYAGGVNPPTECALEIVDGVTPQQLNALLGNRCEVEL